MLHLLLEFVHHFDDNLKDSIYNFRNLLRSQSGFAVPEYCEAIDLHLPPLTNMGQLTLELEELHEGYLKQHPETGRCEDKQHFGALPGEAEILKRVRYMRRSSKYSKKGMTLQAIAD